MTRFRIGHGRGAVLAGALILAVTLSSVRAQGPSEPQPVFPALPDVENVAVAILDLEAAPPAAQTSIVQLAQLGAYPLTADLEALPNEALDASTGAYMLVNLFLPGRGEQFPTPPEQALTILDEVLLAEVPVEEVWTAGALRDILLVILGLAPEREAELRTFLTERYPALQAGNPEAPLTRAGAALMMTIALEYLNTLPS